VIRTLTYRSNLDGKDGTVVAQGIRAQVSKLVRTRNTIRGVKVTFDSEKVDVALRMSGVDRWRISRDARKIASYLLASQKLAFNRPLQAAAELTEPTNRNLTLDQGRTPQSRTGGRPRAGAGTVTEVLPEDWWGDELPL
jgi:hypothetical protein